MLCLLHSITNMQETSLHESSHYGKCRQKASERLSRVSNNQLCSTSSVALLYSLHSISNKQKWMKKSVGSKSLIVLQKSIFLMFYSLSMTFCDALVLIFLLYCKWEMHSFHFKGIQYTQQPWRPDALFFSCFIPVEKGQKQ